MHEATHRDSEASSALALRDGSTLELHPMDAADASSLLRFHKTLSPETTRLRFFNVHPDLSARELERFTHVDHNSREAIVATSAGEIVGVARFDRLADDTEAEVAFVVADAWQGLGLGTALFGRLLERARDLGVTHFVADTLADNRRMQAVFHHCGLPMSTDTSYGVVHCVIDLADDRVCAR